MSWVLAVYLKTEPSTFMAHLLYSEKQLTNWFVLEFVRHFLEIELCELVTSKSITGIIWYYQTQISREHGQLGSCMCHCK